MMKKINQNIFLLPLACLFALLACEQTTPEFGDTYSKVEGINGAFKLTQVIQTDERTASFDNTLDISGFFLRSTPPELNFSSADRSFTLAPGDSPNFLGESGSWKFDDEEFPTQLILTSNGQDLTLELNRTIREIDNTLEFNFRRACFGKAALTYTYIFTRQ
ncbi:MAG: DUF5004 domain-containing protein [Bacteroidota bacterium]